MENNPKEKAEEFEIWVQEKTDYSVLDCADYDCTDGYIIDVESILNIAKAYHKSKVEAISDAFKNLKRPDIDETIPRNNWQGLRKVHNKDSYIKALDNYADKLEQLLKQ